MKAEEILTRLSRSEQEVDRPEEPELLMRYIVRFSSSVGPMYVYLAGEGMRSFYMTTVEEEAVCLEEHEAIMVARACMCMLRWFSSVAVDINLIGKRVWSDEPYRAVKWQ